MPLKDGAQVKKKKGQRPEKGQYEHWLKPCYLSCSCDSTKCDIQTDQSAHHSISGSPQALGFDHYQHLREL